MSKDLRHAFRALLQDRTVGLISLLTLTVALTLAALTLAILDAVMFHPLPYKGAGRVFNMGIDTRTSTRSGRVSPSLADMRRWEDLEAIEVAAAWSDLPFGCITRARIPIRVDARFITESYLALHEALPVQGRAFSAADMDPSAPLVALVGHTFWQSQLNGAKVTGTTIRCDTQVATIVGVLPPGLHSNVAIWLPLRLAGPRAERRGANLTVHARLGPDASIPNAAAQLTSLLQPGATVQSEGRVTGVRLDSVLEATVIRYIPAARVLVGGVMVILALAAVNVCGLFLTRIASRRREMAVRLAIGASRAQLIRQLFFEALVLTATSATLGAYFAWMLFDAIVPILPFALPGGSQLTLSAPVLLVLGVVAVLLAIVIGGFAALNVLRRDLQRELMISSTSISGRLSRRTVKILITAQVALTLAITAAGGSLIGSYARLMAVDLGFDPTRVVAFKVAPVDVSAPAKLDFYWQVAQRVSTLPSVEAAGLVDHFPLGETTVSVSAAAQGESVGVGFRQVVADYFNALGVRASQGSLPRQATTSGQLVAVINESAARRLFPDQAVGSTFSIGRKNYQVAAVVPDFIHGGPLGKAQPEVFVPFDPNDGRSRMLPAMTAVVRTRASDSGFSNSVQELVRSIGPAAVIEDIRSGNGWLADRVAVPRHRAILFVILGAVGLLLMIVLVFSTTAYAVAKRTGEIALRMALGAPSSAVLRTTLLDALWPIVGGLAIGLLLAIAFGHVLRSLLFGVSPTDLQILSLVAGVVSAVALISAWIPARRVIHVDPVANLRRE